MKAMLRSIRFSAEALGVSPFTIRRLIAAGQIQAVNIGARRLIPEAEIERWNTPIVKSSAIQFRINEVERQPPDLPDE